ncbi:MAG: hypothetical protein AAFW87_14290 [Pseudomonadota bacterium]
MTKTPKHPPDAQKSASGVAKPATPAPKIIVSKQVFTDFAAI